MKTQVLWAGVLIGLAGAFGHIIARANQPVDFKANAALHGDYAPVAAARPRFGVALKVGKCINMGGMLERRVEGDLGPPLRDGDLATVKDSGFATIRLPINVAAHAAKTPPYRINPKFLNRISHVVDVATKQRLNIILDLHAYTEVMDDPTGQKDRFVAIWQQLAERFANAPASVWFELLNEPTGQFWSNVDVWTIFTPALAAIRTTNPVRPVIISGGRSDVDSLDKLTLPDDPNLVPTFHFYEPMAFTHQGANWTSRARPVGRRFTQSDANLIRGRLVRVKSFMQRTGEVPLLGEFGAYDIAGISTADRLAYYGTISAAFASIGVQSCAWSFTNGFSLYRGGKWVSGFPAAILTTKP